MSSPKCNKSLPTHANLTIPAPRETAESLNRKEPKKRRKCPLCSRNLQLFYINIEQMLLMCEYDYCDFPFGYEPIQIVYDENQLVDNPPPATPDFWEYPVRKPNDDSKSDTSTVVSNTSDYGYESGVPCDEGTTETLSVRLSKRGKKRKEQKEFDEKVALQVAKFKQLNEELNAIKSCAVRNRQIKNKKWLSNLKSFEMTLNCPTGQKFINDDEIELLKEDEPKSNLEGVEISIDPKALIPTIHILKKPKTD